MALKFSTTIVMFCFIAFLILANHVVSPRQLLQNGRRETGGDGMLPASLRRENPYEVLAKQPCIHMLPYIEILIFWRKHLSHINTYILIFPLYLSLVWHASFIHTYIYIYMLSSNTREGSFHREVDAS
ncbi:hypothetical protein I3843_11G040100 [Carya illinoinensis]|nr:hypothetical protein I3843_11G040100 [Carya illinoinensis]